MSGQKIINKSVFRPGSAQAHIRIVLSSTSSLPGKGGGGGTTCGSSIVHLPFCMCVRVCVFFVVFFSLDEKIKESIDVVSRLCFPNVLRGTHLHQRQES